MQQKLFNLTPSNPLLYHFQYLGFSFSTLMLQHAWLFIKLSNLQSSIAGGGPTR